VVCSSTRVVPLAVAPPIYIPLDVPDPQGRVCDLDGVCDDVAVLIEKAPNNARRIYTAVDVQAAIDVVWKILTDYEKLHEVVPSLVKNKVLERREDGGARLEQVGGAKIAGFSFTAKTILDVRIFTETNPLPAEVTMDYLLSKKSDISGGGGGIISQAEKSTDYVQSPTVVATTSIDKPLPLKRDLFPQPNWVSTSLPYRDITMQNVEGEGDFDHYQGVWRVQSHPDDASWTRLTYAVEIKPKGFMPVQLIEGRIATDLKSNLSNLRFVAESKQKNISTLHAVESKAAAFGVKHEEIARQQQQHEAKEEEEPPEEENKRLSHELESLYGELLTLRSKLGGINSLVKVEMEQEEE